VFPTSFPARRIAGARELAITKGYGLAGDAAAAGLASAAGLAIAAGLDASAGAAAEADASGAAGALSSDLLQAVPRNNETSTRSRTLRIASSLNSTCSTVAQMRNGPRIRQARRNFKGASGSAKCHRYLIIRFFANEFLFRQEVLTVGVPSVLFVRGAR
jgi:hypothetical protein